MQICHHYRAPSFTDIKYCLMKLHKYVYYNMYTVSELAKPSKTGYTSVHGYCNTNK